MTEMMTTDVRAIMDRSPFDVSAVADLREVLNRDPSRYRTLRDAVATIQRQWEANQREWRDGCAEVLSAYRIVQRQVELERERAYSGVVREMAVTRAEKLQRLQRDFKLKLFQIKEEELEMRVDEVETLRRSEVEEMEEALGREERRAASITTKLKETKEALARSVKERDDKEVGARMISAAIFSISCRPGITSWLRSTLTWRPRVARWTPRSSARSLNWKEP